jgi:hypothetical protein
MMTDEQIAAAKTKLEGAFQPLRCKVQDYDARAKMRFKIIDENDKTVVEAAITEHDVRDAVRLADIIEQAREVAQAKGFALT